MNEVSALQEAAAAHERQMIEAGILLYSTGSFYAGWAAHAALRSTEREEPLSEPAAIFDSPETGWPSRIIDGKHVPCTHDGRYVAAPLALPSEPVATAETNPPEPWFFWNKHLSKWLLVEADLARWHIQQGNIARGPYVLAAPLATRGEPTDEQIDALDTFCLAHMAPRGKESVRAFARAVLALRAPTTSHQPAAREALTEDEIVELMDEHLWQSECIEGKAKCARAIRIVLSTPVAPTEPKEQT